MTGARKKKKRRLRSIAIAIVLIFLISLAFALIYIKVQGFKQALVELVDEASDGNLALEIGATSIDYAELEFRLSDISIQKVDNNIPSDLESIAIPFIDVNLGSFISVLESGQFDLENLIISEPIAKIQSGEQKTNQEKDQPVNIAHEITVLFPGIKAILDRFDIHHFTIQRAGIELNKTGKDIQVRFIDLLVDEWNMRDLSEEATLHFKAGAQEIELNNSAFGFSEITFDYQTGDLRIEDYSFMQVDSLRRPVVAIEGASVVISDLDYEALMNEEYKLRDIEVNQPVFKVYLYPHEKKENQSRQPVSDLLKKNLGELVVETGAINQADILLTSYSETDSIIIELPKLNFSTSNLVVTADSSTLMMEQFNLELSATSLDLGNDLGVSFSNLTYDQSYNMTINDLEVSDLSNNMDLMKSTEIDLYRFNIFDYLYNIDLTADSVIMRSGNVTIREDPDKFTDDEKNKNQKKQPEIHIGQVRLENIDMLYSLAGRRFEITDMVAVADNIIKENEMVFDLRFLETPSIIVRDPADEINADVSNFYFQPNKLSIDELDVQYQTLNVDIENFEAQPESFDPKKPFYYNWNRLSISKINASGSIPANNDDDQNTNSGNGRDIALEHVLIDQMDINVKLNDSSSISTVDSQLRISDLSIGSGLPSFTHFQLLSSNLLFNNPSIELSTGPAMFDNLEESIIHQITLKTKNQDSLHVQKLQIGNTEANDSSWLFQRLKMADIEFDQNGSQFVSHADSLLLNGTEIKKGKNPFISELFLFGPKVSTKSKDRQPTSKTDKKKSKTDGKPINLSEVIGKATIYPGTYAVNDLLIRFGKISLNTRDKSGILDIDGITFDTENSMFDIGRLETTSSDLKLSDLNVSPKASFQPEYETDIAGGHIDELLFRNVEWDQLLQENQFHAEELEINSFDIVMRRDKTLPDPDPVNKPHLLAELLPLSEKFSLQRITSNGGSLTYREVGEKTGKEGYIRLDSIRFTMNLMNDINKPENVLSGSASLYNRGNLSFMYSRLAGQRFDMEIRLTDFPLDSLNHMIDPLESVMIKSGYLHEMDISFQADSVQAVGSGLITYDDLHIEIFKRHEPDVRNFGSRLLTLLADGIVLKHSKTDAIGEFEQQRIVYKSPINYWVKSCIHAAMTAVRKGDDAKNVPD